MLDESNGMTWRGFDDEGANTREAAPEVLMSDLFLGQGPPVPESVDVGVGMPLEKEREVVSSGRPHHELVGLDAFHYLIMSR